MFGRATNRLGVGPHSSISPISAEALTEAINIKNCVVGDVLDVISCAKFHKSSAVAEMGDCGHNTHGPKGGGYCTPFAGELRPHLTQRRLGRGLAPYQVVP